MQRTTSDHHGIETSSETGLGPSAGRHPPASIDPLVEAMVCELQSAALACVVVASAVNRLGQGRSVTASPSALLGMMPHDTAIQLASTRWMLDAGIAPMVLLAIHDFMSELEPARAVMQRYAVDSAVLGAGRGVVLHRLVLIDTWKRLTRLALEAVDRLDRDLGVRLPSGYSGSAAMLKDLLLEAEAGHSPCITDDGETFVPILPQRRRSARRTLLQNCIVTYRDRTYRAFVQNISAGGLGLSRAPALVRDEPITVELRSGRRFTGTVVWSNGSFTGMRFTVPLSQRDPLLDG